MTEIIKPVANESSDDRNPWDELSPQADASTNVFEQNPDDSVDITAEYDDQKANSLEEQLKGTDFELSPDHGEQQEIALSPKDYENFTNNYLGELFSALENPANADDANQEAINDQITVATNLFGISKNQDLSQPREVFQNITNLYDQLAETAMGNHQTEKAETFHRRANAVARMEDSFNSYITEQHARKQNENASTTNDTASESALPGDVIS